jgi:hypothetical protein
MLIIGLQLFPFNLGKKEMLPYISMRMTNFSTPFKMLLLKSFVSHYNLVEKLGDATGRKIKIALPGEMFASEW